MSLSEATGPSQGCRTQRRQEEVALARRPYDIKGTSISNICKMPQIPRSTLFRYVQVKRKTLAGDVNG